MPRKNPAAVKLGKLRAKKGRSMVEVGRLGGIASARAKEKQGAPPFPEGTQEAGGAARAKALTREQRAAIARKAAAARWGKG